MQHDSSDAPEATDGSVDEWMPWGQLHDWDCGVSAVHMVVSRRSRVVPARGDYDALLQRCPSTSTWTIDLGHLLVREGCGVVLTTLVVGVDPQHRQLAFYRDKVHHDEHCRIQRAFDEAEHVGLVVLKRSISWQHLAHHFASPHRHGGCRAIILLVDEFTLRQRDCVQGEAPSLFTTLCGLDCVQSPHRYTGHFIVIIDYCPTKQSFAALDPLYPHLTPMWIPSTCLDAARTVRGTDEDVLFVFHDADHADMQALVSQLRDVSLVHSHHMRQ